MTSRGAEGAQAAAWFVVIALFGWFVALLAWVGRLSSEKRVPEGAAFASPLEPPDNRS